MVWVVVALALSLGGSWFAFGLTRAGTPWMWIGVLAAQMPMALMAVRKLRQDGAVKEQLQPRWGDISMGVGSALLLYALSWGVRVYLTPANSPREAWLLRAYLQVGDPAVVQKNLTLLGATVLLIAVMEEVVWRGYVFATLETKLGSQRAWIVGAVLYAIGFVPSAWQLRDAVGPNPLVIAAALAGGLAWGYLVRRSGRLVPAILSHAIYLWFIVAQFRLLVL